MFSPLNYSPEDLFDDENKDGLDSERFVVGDSVYIHPDLRETDKGASVTEDMLNYAGSLARIVRVLGNSYKLDVDDADWVWDDYCLLSQNEFAQYITGVAKVEIKRLEGLI